MLEEGVSEEVKNLILKLNEDIEEILGEGVDVIAVVFRTTDGKNLLRLSAYCDRVVRTVLRAFIGNTEADDERIVTPKIH